MQQKEKSFGLSATALKIIALVIMTVDHVGAYGSNMAFARENYLIIRQIGRLAAPVFLFLLTESMKHTKNRRAFFKRMYLASLVVGLWNAVLGWHLGYSFGNIFQTFAWISAAVFCIDIYRRERNWHEGAKLLLLVLLSLIIDKIICAGFFDFNNADLVRETVRAFINSPRQVEYSVGMILLGILWYYLPDKLYCALTLLLFSIPAYFGFRQYPELTMFSGIQYAMAGAVPLILLYNGEKGRGMKNFFYVYYPVHVYIIAIINRLIK